MTEKQTSVYHPDTIVDLTTDSGVEWRAEIEKTGEIPDELRRELGAKALEASYILVRLPGDQNQVVHRWMDIREGDVGTIVRNSVRDGEEYTPEQRLGLPSAEAVARDSMSAEHDDKPIGAEQGESSGDEAHNNEAYRGDVLREKNAGEILDALSVLNTEKLQDMVHGESHRLLRHATDNVSHQNYQILQPLMHGGDPVAVMRSRQGVAARQSIDQLVRVARNEDVGELLRRFRRDVEQAGQLLGQLQQAQDFDPAMREIVHDLSRPLAAAHTTVRHMEQSAQSFGLIPNSGDIPAAMSRLLDEAQYSRHGGVEYGAALKRHIDHFESYKQQYNRQSQAMAKILHAIERIKAQLRHGLGEESEAGDAVVIERQESFADDLVKRATPLKMSSTEALYNHFPREQARERVTEDSIHTASSYIEQLAEAKGDFAAYMNAYYDERFGEEPIDQLRLNTDLRAALLQYFEREIDAYPRRDEFPERVRLNNPDNLKAINYSGYPVEKATSGQYTAMLMLSMLDASFNAAGEDRTHSHDRHDGAPGYGMHRDAARTMLRYLADKKQP